jgi:transposase-like protein
MKLSKQAYTAEFKELAVIRVKGGQSIGAVVKDLGLSDQTLRNRVKAAAEGKLNGAGGKELYGSCWTALDCYLVLGRESNNTP